MCLYISGFLCICVHVYLHSSSCTWTLRLTAVATCKMVLTKGYCYQMGFLESCYELNWRFQHGSQQAAVHPAKRHGRGCQQHKFALLASEPKTGCGPDKIVRLSAQRRAWAFLLSLNQCSRAFLFFTEERGKIVSKYKPRLKWIEKKRQNIANQK